MREIIKLKDEILFQSFGLYQWKYDFNDVVGYKVRLDSITEKLKDLLTSEKAVFYGDCEYLNKRQQKKMGKILIRCYNSECETSVRAAKFNNVYEMENKIEKSYTQLNKYAEDFKICIAENYKNLYLEKLFLSYEYEETKKQKKDEEKFKRALEREEIQL